MSQNYSSFSDGVTLWLISTNNIPIPHIYRVW